MFHARLCGLMVKTPPSALLFQYLSTQANLGGNAGSNPATGISDTCNTCRLAWAKPPPSDALAVACVTNPILGSNARSTVGLCGLMVKTPPSVLLFLRHRFLGGNSGTWNMCALAWSNGHAAACADVLPAVGFEPTRSYLQWILSPPP